MQKLILTLAALFLSCDFVQADAVLIVEGAGARVNRGAGFSPVAGTRALEVGNIVSVRNAAPGRGVLVYDDGCKVTVNPGDVVRVTAPSPCRTSEIPDQARGVGAANAAMGAIGAGVLAGAATVGVVAATRANTATPVIPPVTRTPCASAGC